MRVESFVESFLQGWGQPKKAAMQIKVVVIGSRNFVDGKLLDDALNHYHDRVTIGKVIICERIGAGYFARRWAAANNIPWGMYLTNFKMYGINALTHANTTLLDTESPHLVLTFGGQHRTADLARRANAQHIQVVRPARKKIGGWGKLTLNVVS